MHKIVSIKTGKKTHWKILVYLPGIEPGLPAASSSVLTTIYTNHAITILMYKLRYINIT